MTKSQKDNKNRSTILKFFLYKAINSIWEITKRQMIFLPYGKFRFVDHENKNNYFLPSQMG